MGHLSPPEVEVVGVERDEVKQDGDDTKVVVEWYIKLFWGVHFAANWVSVH